MTKFGGLPNVVSAVPEITSFQLNKDHDFIVLGCDGIYDQLSDKDVVNSVWMTFDESVKAKTLHSQCGLGVDMIIKTSMIRKSLDNVTCLIIAFDNFEKAFNENNQNETFEKEFCARKYNSDNLCKVDNNPKMIFDDYRISSPGNLTKNEREEVLNKISNSEIKSLKL